MINALIVIILIAILGGAVYYLKKSSKKETKCVGCPYAASCTSSAPCDKDKQK